MLISIHELINSFTKKASTSDDIRAYNTIKANTPSLNSFLFLLKDPTYEQMQKFTGSKHPAFDNYKPLMTRDEKNSVLKKVLSTVIEEAIAFCKKEYKSRAQNFLGNFFLELSRKQDTEGKEILSDLYLDLFVSNDIFKTSSKQDYLANTAFLHRAKPISMSDFYVLNNNISIYPTFLKYLNTTDVKSDFKIKQFRVLFLRMVVEMSFYFNAEDVEKIMSYLILKKSNPLLLTNKAIMGSFNFKNFIQNNFKKYKVAAKDLILNQLFLLQIATLLEVKNIYNEITDTQKDISFAVITEKVCGRDYWKTTAPYVELDFDNNRVKVSTQALHMGLDALMDILHPKSFAEFEKAFVFDRQKI